MSSRRHTSVRFAETIDKALRRAALEDERTVTQWIERAVRNALIAEGRLPVREASQEAA